MRVSLLFFSFSLISIVNTLNILIYSTTIGYSHVKYEAKLADVLVDAGHKVVTVINEFNVNIKAVPTKAEVIRIPADEATVTMQQQGEDEMVAGFWTLPYDDVWSGMQFREEIAKVYDNQCRNALDYPGLLDRLREYEFDAAIAEPWDMCGFGIIHLLGIKNYAMSMTNSISESIEDIIGLPSVTSYVPGVEMDGNDEMSLAERFRNMQTAYACRKGMELAIATQQETFDLKYGEFPAFRELLANSSLVFTNSDPLIDFPRPTLTKIIDLGGISAPEKGELGEHWNEVLGRRARTVVISFGTVAKAYRMPESFKKGLLGAISSFPDVTFIFKYEQPDDGIAEGRENLEVAKWIPQTELLSDPRVVGFVTHCGAGSVHEGAARGVPMLAIPLFHDQKRNARMVEKAGIAIRFDKAQLEDQGAITKAIKQLLEDEELKQNAVSVSSMLADRPVQPRGLLVKYVEFMAAHGPLRNLDPHGRKLTWLQYYNLDIIGLALGAIAMSFVLLAICLLCGCLFYTRRKTQYRRCQDDDFFLHS